MSHTPEHRADPATTDTDRETGTVSQQRIEDRTPRSDDVRHDDAHNDARYVGARADEARQDEAREKFGGINWGASFFGWLVAIAVAILLTSIVGATVAAVGSSTSITQSEAERQAGNIGLAAAIVLLGVLAIGYYLGGYVAGRMSRFDGGRQGVGVWVIGLVVTILAVALGAIFGNQYNVLDRVSLPNLPISTDQLGWGALITAAAVLVLTLLAALLGGKAGHRYHHRVDRATWNQ